MIETKGRIESRWPAAIAILAVIVILEFLPGRLRIMPVWFPYLVALLLLIPMVGENITRNAVVAAIERVDIYLFVLISIVLMILTLARLIQAIIFPAKDIGGLSLLVSAVALWIINVIASALLYWELDRGGPNLRAGQHEEPPDILFPDLPAESSKPLVFVDYLFFAFTTSTAFSPTETYPITTRMKLLMMAQSTISLILIVIVGARAINVIR